LLNDRIILNNELEKNAKETHADLFTTPSRDLPEDTHEDHKNTASIASALAEIRNKHFTKASLEFYRCIKQYLELYVYSLTPLRCWVLK
jgi:hypothetical protein